MNTKPSNRLRLRRRAGAARTMSFLPAVLFLIAAFIAIASLILDWRVTASAGLLMAGEGVIYYLDDSAGSDSNSGTSPDTAWRTLSKASDATFGPGDSLLLKRGGSWSGTLYISESGTADEPITVSAFGDGPLPVIQGGNDCVIAAGSWIALSRLQISNCGWAGIKFPSGSYHNRIEGSLITGSVAGVYVAGGATDHKVVGNTIRDNTKMSVLTPGGDDDSGAFGVLLNGDRTEVANNTISGHDAFSYDYGRDGAAVDVYGGQANQIHHNLAVDNETFSELGNSRSRDNAYAYNVVRSSLNRSFFLVTRGSGSSFGPVANTKLLNNTVFMTGAASQGFVCDAGCNSNILTMRNNVVQAVAKVGYADDAFDEDYNLYYGGRVQFRRGGHSIVANPLFINAAAGDLHLDSASPAIDSGVNSEYTADFEGASVPSDGNGDGILATDRGAYEKLASGPQGTPSSTPTPLPIPTPPATAVPAFTPSPTPTAAPSPTLTRGFTPSTTPTLSVMPSPTVTTLNPIPPSAPTPAPLAAAFPAAGGAAHSGSSSAASLMLGAALICVVAAVCVVARKASK